MSLFDRFRLSRGSGDKMEYIFAGVLIILIVGAIALMVSSMNGKSGPPANAPSEFHVYCTNCEKEQVVKREALQVQPPALQEGENFVDPATIRPKCPLCDANALIVERQCPSCKKYYVTEAMKSGAAAMDMDIAAPEAEVCPHCGTDIMKYYMERAAEGK